MNGTYTYAYAYSRSTQTFVIYLHRQKWKLYIVEKFCECSYTKNCVYIHNLYLFVYKHSRSLYTNMVHVCIRANLHVYKHEFVSVQTIGDLYNSDYLILKKLVGVRIQTKRCSLVYKQYLVCIQTIVNPDNDKIFSKVVWFEKISVFVYEPNFFVYVFFCLYTNTKLFVYELSQCLYTCQNVRIQTHACSYTNNCGSLHGRNLPKIKKIYVFVYEQNVGCIRGFLFVYEQKYDRIQTKICLYTDNNVCIRTNLCTYTNELMFVYVKIRFSTIARIREPELVYVQFRFFVYKLVHCSYTNCFLFVYEQFMFVYNHNRCFVYKHTFVCIQTLACLYT